MLHSDGLREIWKSYDFYYNYTWAFPFERHFDHHGSVARMTRLWPIGCGLCILYLILIVLGRRVLKDRSPFDLRTPLILWNLALAIFSTLGAVRFAPDFFHILYHFGFEESVCATSFDRPEPGVWVEAFALSKAVEFGDTVFIVLRKRPLMFLHWYHHITVLLYTWHSYTMYVASGRWFIMMNYSVHAIMYTYYSLRALGARFPRWIPMTITMLQLSQMFVGVYVVVYVYLALNRGVVCEAHYKNLNWAFVMYFTYALLFIHFFYKTYFGGGKGSVTAQQKIKKSAQNGNISNGVVADGDTDKVSNGMTLRSRNVANGAAGDHAEH